MVKNLDLLLAQVALGYVPLVAGLSMIASNFPEGNLEQVVQGGFYFAVGFMAERIFVGLRDIRNSDTELERKREELAQASVHCIADSYRNYTLH